MGAPGSGKGTQSQIISKNFGIPQISTGDILRQETNEKTEIGLHALSFMEKGDLVPDSVLIAIIENRIIQDDCTDGFILDGFPRNTNQAKVLEILMNKYEKNIYRVIFLDVDTQILIDRLLNRQKEEHRIDDYIDSIQHRISVFEKVTRSVLDYYDSQGILTMIQGAGMVEQITNKIQKELSLR